jgi:hypothetical protein
LRNSERKKELKQIRAQMKTVPAGEARAKELAELEAWVERIDDDIRYAHFLKLRAAISALDGRRVTPDQKDAFVYADGVCGRMAEKGFWTQDHSDIEEMKAAFARLEGSYPDLLLSIQTWRRENPENRASGPSLEKGR